MVGNVYKNIDYSDARITEFKTHASILVDSILDKQGTKLLFGDFSNYKYSYSDISDPNNSELSVITNYYADLVHHSLNNMFYDDWQFKPNSKIGYYNKNQKRTIGSKVTTISIPRKVYAEGITQNTVNLSLYPTPSLTPDFVLRDDGNGNLIDVNRFNETYGEIVPHVQAWYTFDEGFLYTNDTNAIYENTQIVIDTSPFFREGTYHNVSWDQNLKNLYAKFNGTTSYITIPHNNIDFNNTFAISFLCWADRINETILVKSNGTDTIYPFKFVINSGGYLDVSLSDGFNTYNITSTTQLVGGAFSDTWFHVLFQFNKSNNKIELIINGILEDSLTIELNGIINNLSNTVIGKFNSTYYQGLLDDLMIFDTILTPTQYLDFAVRQKHETDNFDYYAGNVFYSLGLVVLTHNRYDTMTELSDYTLSFKATRTIYEHEYICTVDPNEFNNTYNSSILTSINSTTIHSNFINTTWSPYVTSIGLYDEQLNLVAVGKSSIPIKVAGNNKMSFIVKFDLMDNNIFKLFPAIFMDSNFVASNTIEGDSTTISIDVKNISKRPENATVIFKIPLLLHVELVTATINANATVPFQITKNVAIGYGCQTMTVSAQEDAEGVIEVPIHSVARMLESNCVWLHQNSYIQFTGIPINPATLTKMGTANTFVLGDKIICNSTEADQGTIYNVKFKDYSNNDYHFPLAEGRFTTCYNVEAPLLSNIVGGSWTIQSEYHYNLTYGCTKIETTEGLLYVPYNKNKQKIYTI